MPIIMDHTFEPTEVFESWTYIILNLLKFDECISPGYRHTDEGWFQNHKKQFIDK